MIELERSDQMIRFWITGHSSGVDPPQTDYFIGAPACYAVVLWDVKDGTCDDVLVSKHLDGAFLIEIPNDDFHVGAGSEEVVFVRLFGAPIDVEYVKFVAVFELLTRFNPLMHTSWIE